MGCAALDKGTNQPNKFLETDESQLTLPYFSDGRRDDVIQAAYVRAMTEFSSSGKHPNASGLWAHGCGAHDRHVARPCLVLGRAAFSAFPAPGPDLWSDGPAWERGHWLNGHAGAVPLSDVVAEICREAGRTGLMTPRACVAWCGALRCQARKAVARPCSR